MIEEHKPKVEEMQPIVESGPVSTNVDDDDYVEEEEEGEVITASALFAKEVDGKLGLMNFDLILLVLVVTFYLQSKFNKN